MAIRHSIWLDGCGGVESRVTHARDVDAMFREDRVNG